MVKGPVFKVHCIPIIRNFLIGITRAHTHPMGYTSLSERISSNSHMPWTGQNIQLDHNGWEVDRRTPRRTGRSIVTLRRQLRWTNLILKSMLRPLPTVTKNMPSTQARTVFATSPPSVGRTAARTSSYGESSVKAASSSIFFSTSLLCAAALRASIVDCGRFGSHW